MKLATLRHHGSTVAARVEGAIAIPIAGFADVSQLLQQPQWRTLARRASSPTIDVEETSHAPVVPHPGKIVCVGLNYAHHIEEMGRERPEFPTLFAKFPEALIGPYDPIRVPDYADQHVDWEGELAVVLGRTARRVSAADAGDYIAGYCVANDVTMRDFQYRTPQWLQGKTFEATCPIGPTLVTGDEFSGRGILQTHVDDVVMQTACTGDLVFTPALLIEYISHIVTLQAGDVILTGTPGGVGHPSGAYLHHGSVVRTEIEGLGTLRNTVLVDAPAP